jgi:hypothetical protein
MEVQIDNVWATPSTLHMRVTVWGPSNKWRHRYDASVPMDDIDEHVAAMFGAYVDDTTPEEDHHQTALF